MQKTGDIFKSVESGDTYTPVFEESGLSGATFDIIAVSDIYYPNGEVRIKSGTVVDTVTTDENGEAYTKELFLGDYKAVETKVPDGYVLDNSEHLHCVFNNTNCIDGRTFETHENSRTTKQDRSFQNLMNITDEVCR